MILGEAMNTILEVKDLNLWYGEHHALHDISVNIPKQNITALIGPSGCGKSTFLKTLNRMNDMVENIKILTMQLSKSTHKATERFDLPLRQQEKQSTLWNN